ncbi:MAG: hypothetical protein KF773_17415 [Deltaproteobacteria bacterium]|nr:hypothetical protein [Deltaproteobacteria bacterium]
MMRKFERFTMKYGSVIVPPRGRLRQRFPGIDDPAITVPKIVEKFEEAKRRLLNTDVTGARADLNEVLGWIRDNPATATKVPKLSVLLTRAYVTLAIMEEDARNKKAALRWMSHLHSTIPDHPAIGEKYGQDAETLYNAALKAGARTPHGKLIVRVTHPRARIFIEGIERGSGGRFEGSFPVPEDNASLRIYVEVDGTGYAFERSVLKHYDMDLDVDWDLHRSLVETKDYVALIIPPELKARERELLDMTALQVSSSTYYLLGLRKAGDQRYLTARVYTAGFGFQRQGEILLDDEQEDERMAAFAAFLERREFSPLVTLGIGRSESKPATAPTYVKPFSHSAAFGVVIVGGVLILGGGGLGALSRFAPDECADFPCTTVGIAMAGVGVVGVVGAIWWHARNGKRSSPPVTIAPARGGAIVGVGWDF